MWEESPFMRLSSLSSQELAMAPFAPATATQSAAVSTGADTAPAERPAEGSGDSILGRFSSGILGLLYT